MAFDDDLAEELVDLEDRLGTVSLLIDPTDVMVLAWCVRRCHEATEASGMPPGARAGAERIRVLALVLEDVLTEMVTAGRRLIAEGN